MSLPNQPNPYNHNSIRILFAGGCHVVGYPVGEAASFPEIVRRRLEASGISLELRKLAYLKLTHAAKLEAACSDCAPDLLVLQLGHFELSRPLSQYLRSILPFGRRNAAGTRSESPVYLVGHGWPFRIRAAAKEAIDSILGHPLVDFAQFESQLNALLQQAERWAPPEVILLSPLPCVDPLSMYYRRRATAIMRRVAARHGTQFLDLMSSFSDCGVGPEAHFFDAVHLGAHGHRVIGAAIAEHLVATLSRSRVQAAIR